VLFGLELVDQPILFLFVGGLHWLSRGKDTCKSELVSNFQEETICRGSLLGYLNDRYAIIISSLLLIFFLLQAWKSRRFHLDCWKPDRLLTAEEFCLSSPPPSLPPQHGKTLEVLGLGYNPAYSRQKRRRRPARKGSNLLL